MFDYKNDTEGIYVGFCTRQHNDKSIGDGKYRTEYSIARYGDLDTAKDNLSHVIASFGLQYLTLIPEETLVLMAQFLVGLDSVPSVDVLEGKALVLEAKPIGIFMLCKGFPRGEEGTTFKVVQDHANCVEGYCLQLEPNFSHSY